MFLQCRYTGHYSIRSIFLEISPVHVSALRSLFGMKKWNKNTEWTCTQNVGGVYTLRILQDFRSVM